MSSLTRGVRVASWLALSVWAGPAVQAAYPPVDITPEPITSDATVRYDYDIVYVRSPRWIGPDDDLRGAHWAEFGHPFSVNPGSDLMLLHPNGAEELLVAGGPDAIQDPYVSFDGQWVFYTRFYLNSKGDNQGADIFKVHVPTKQVVQLTNREKVFNREGTAPNAKIYNIHPCPVPGGKVVFVSNRNGFLPPVRSYPVVALQLTLMDEDGSNVETVGHLNLGTALHPTILTDGRIIFSSLEDMGLRADILWGIWSIYPDGTGWGPIISAFEGTGAPSGYHFQTQLSDGRIVFELYYNQNQRGFGTLFTVPTVVPPGETAFGPGDLKDPRNPKFPMLSFTMQPKPFTPYGQKPLTLFTLGGQDRPSLPSIFGDTTSPLIGKVTHPSGAPDNHLLLVWTLGPIGGSSGTVKPEMGPRPIDSGLYLLKNGQPVGAPGEFLLIKNDPNYNEQWPRALVPYQRMYGMAAPAVHVLTPNAGLTPAQHLPTGTPFGYVGTSSLYKRDSAPLGRVLPGTVTAVTTATTTAGKQEEEEWNWRSQGADAGKYENREIHAIRIVAFEPNALTPSKNAKGQVVTSGYPQYNNHISERLRILGEVPVRKFQGDGTQPMDPDGHPDTSFLAKIPADVSFTFQTIDKDGLILNMAETWHQVRPGEARFDCGGCHAHSQQPTLFEQTLASRPEYIPFDLTSRATLITTAANDESGKQWDSQRTTGLRTVPAGYTVEYHRDIRPILDRSCIPCHTKTWAQPAGGLVLDDDDELFNNFPKTYARLAADEKANMSPRKVVDNNDGTYSARLLESRDKVSHYIHSLQSRRSLLVWKLFGRRLDGISNDEVPGEEWALDDPRRATTTSAQLPGALPLTPTTRLYMGDINYTGEIMPPPSAVAGTYRGPEGQTIQVAPITDEDRRTIARWIDLGATRDKSVTEPFNESGLRDDTRPTLTLSAPRAGMNRVPLTEIRLGAWDYASGLAQGSFSVKASFPVNDQAPGTELAALLQEAGPNTGIWVLPLTTPVTALPVSTLTVEVTDRQDNRSAITRRFQISAAGLGDLNNDGAVTLPDLRLMIEMLIGAKPVDLVRADLTGDGTLSLADLRALIQILITS